ncbi:uncharacterized protein [Prorops nasuta]|uniref:uncharacterized protein n=1 Tax=Prorops nasuta TaxID=863751 RepID=UPI0034CFE71C
MDEEEVTEDAINEGIDSCKFNWNYDQTKLLIDEVQKKWKQLNKKNCFSKKIWREISDNFKKQGYSVSDEQCSIKWKNLKQKFKSIKAHNSQTGANRKDWVYLDYLEDILNPMPEVTPISLASSSKGFRLSSTGCNEDNEIENACCSVPLNRYIKKRERNEKITLKDIFIQKEEHHRENMRMKEKFYKLLKVITCYMLRIEKFYLYIKIFSYKKA